MIKTAIVEEREVPPSELIPHPRNWRTHPKAQLEALRQVLERLGWIQRVIVNRRTGHLLDGHLRVELAIQLGEESIPVEYVDIPEAEEALVLTTLDPLAGMAGIEAPTLVELLREVDATGDLQALLAELSAMAARREIRDADPLWMAEQKKMAAKWGTARGQLWRVEDRHELLIADANVPEVRAWVRERFDPEAVIGDPEYDEDAAAVMAVVDDLAERAALLAPAGKLAYDLCRGLLGWQVRADWVWRRRVPRSMPTRGRAITYHAWILLMTRERAKLGWRRPWPEFSSVIEVEREYEPTYFGHAKGAELFVTMMAGFEWSRWVDPYVGSGTTILAAEHLAKRALGIEQSPGVAGLCLERLSAAGLSVDGPEVVDLPDTDATPSGSRPPRRPKVVARLQAQSPA